MDPWSTHKWLPAGGRWLKISGVWKREHFCSSCKRHFVVIIESGERYAAFPSVFDFDPLAREVSEQWLREPCPSREQKGDAVAYRNRPKPSRAVPAIDSMK